MRARTSALALLAVCLAACVQPLVPAAPQPAQRDVYLPLVSNPSPLATATPTALERCFGNSMRAVAFYRLLIADGRQARAVLRCHPALVEAARQHALAFADGQPWGHCTAGVCPNARARRAGCVMPAIYIDSANYVEELVSGTGDTQAAFDALARSERHRVHLFAREQDGRVNPFFAQQDDVGVAYAESPHGLFWVVMIAPCGATSGE